MIGAGAKHLSMTITRGKFEQLVDSLLNRTRQPCKDCLKDAGISQSEVTEVLLVGGMTRMPKVGCAPRRREHATVKQHPHVHCTGIM